MKTKKPSSSRREAFSKEKRPSRAPFGAPRGPRKARDEEETPRRAPARGSFRGRGRQEEDAPASDRPSFAKSSFGKAPGKKPASGRPSRGGTSERPSAERAPSGRPFRKRPERDEDEASFSKPSFGKAPSKRFSSGKPSFGKTSSDRAEPSERRYPSKTGSGKPSFGKPAFGKSSYGKPAFGKKPFAAKPASARPAYAKTPARDPKPEAAAPARLPAQPRYLSQEREGAASPKGGAVYLWGVHAVREAWRNPNRKCLKLWATTQGLESLGTVVEDAREEGLGRPTPTMAERTQLDALLPQGSVHQGLVLEVLPLPEATLENLIASGDLPDLLLVLDQVTDPHNVGAILRSAAAFGVRAVIMTERNAPATTGVLAKTASGGAEHVDQIYVVNLARALEDLKKAGYWCVGLAEEGKTTLAAMDLTGRTALVLGAEGSGLRRLTREHCDDLAHLPTRPPIGSLNVSNAAAVSLYEVTRQKSGLKD